jgi:hypothetical protein
MTLAKSAKWRERQRAYEAGQLYQWEAQRSVAQAVPPAAPAPTPPPDFSIRTLDGASWTEDSRYMRWLLPTNPSRVVGGVPARGRF